jgi:hypothetical protein
MAARSSWGSMNNGLTNSPFKVHYENGSLRSSEYLCPSKIRRARRCSRGFEQHAARLWDGLRLQAQTRPARGSALRRMVAHAKWHAVGSFERHGVMRFAYYTLRADHTLRAIQAPVKYEHVERAGPDNRQRVLVSSEPATTVLNRGSCRSWLVASSTYTNKVHAGPRSSNQRWSLPSICTNSPRQCRRLRGWQIRAGRWLRGTHRPTADISLRTVSFDRSTPCSSRSFSHARVGPKSA